MTVDDGIRHFVQEFGLILFVFSIGLQVGPSFFSSFKHGGADARACATAIVLLGSSDGLHAPRRQRHLRSDNGGHPVGGRDEHPGWVPPNRPMPMQRTIRMKPSREAMPWPTTGRRGHHLTMIVIRYAFRIRFEKEDEELARISNEHKLTKKVSLEFTNRMLDGHTVDKSARTCQPAIRHLAHLPRRRNPHGRRRQRRTHCGDRIRVICQAETSKRSPPFLGRRTEMTDEGWNVHAPQAELLVSRRILITKTSSTARNSPICVCAQIRHQHHAREPCGRRLIPYQGLELQVGDRVMVVGPAKAVEQVADVLEQLARQVATTESGDAFVGIALGVLLGSIPFADVPTSETRTGGRPVDRGDTDRPLRTSLPFGDYTTMSANLMLREWVSRCSSQRWASVRRRQFIYAVIGGGYRWIGYGFIIE